MNFSPIESPVAGTNQTDWAARQTAQQFEALFLQQLTSALNATADEDENNVFSRTGSDLYKQMFSEHIAKIMADNGGIGLADTILRQLRAPAAAANGKATGLERARAAANAIQQEPTAPLLSGEDLVLEAEVSATLPATPRAPLPGRITSSFGVRADPFNGQQREHHGIDIAAPRGTPIGAAAPGTVVFAGRRGGYGNTVIVAQADGQETLYAHAEQLLVQAGDRVAAGQVIATVGSTGRSTGPHLHFEVRAHGQPVNPLTNFAKDFVLPDR